ncbi:unnamed protein product, partial [Mesorhabditis belari]
IFSVSRVSAVRGTTAARPGFPGEALLFEVL